MLITRLTSIILATLVGTAVTATTVSFTVETTQSTFTPLPEPGAPNATLPALGTLGTAMISLPGITSSDATPLGDPDAPPNAGSVLASITIGSLSASLEPAFGAIAFVSDTTLRFANGSFSSIDVSFPRDAGATPTYAGSFTIVTASDGVTPATFGEVFDTLLDPAAELFFSFNGTTFSGIDTSFAAQSVPPIPLPAGGVLLISALGAVGALRRRRRSAV